jgi:hypothetical protein
MTKLSHIAGSIGRAAVGVTIASIAALSLAVAHEGHQMACSNASINAMKADVQAMPDGASKTTATRELQTAQDMMQKKDMKTCETHLHNAMEAIEK